MAVSCANVHDLEVLYCTQSTFRIGCLLYYLAHVNLLLSHLIYDKIED